MIKFTKMPEVEPEEQIYGFQILLDNYSVDVYFCFFLDRPFNERRSESLPGL